MLSDHQVPRKVIGDRRSHRFVRVEAAEAIASGLRNSGIAVRPNRPETESDFLAMLANHPPDFVLIARDATSVPLATVMQHVATSGKDLPVLLLLDSIDDASLQQASSIGVRNVVRAEPPSHWVAVVFAVGAFLTGWPARGALYGVLSAAAFSLIYRNLRNDPTLEAHVDRVESKSLG